MGENPLNPRKRRWLLIGSVALFGLLLWLASNVLLVFFSAVLVALLLRGLTNLVIRLTRLSPGWSLGLVVVSLAAVLSLTGWLLAPQIGRQIQRLGEELPRAWAHVEKQVNQQPWGQQVQRLIPGSKQMASGVPSALNKATGFLSSTLGFVANVVIILFVALYLAAEPRRYIGGIVRLLPPPKRSRAREVFDTLGIILQRWLLGRFLLMAANAVVTAIGLWLLGVPLAVTLGLLSGLLNFVPNLGPIIAAVPAILLGFLEGPWTALYVTLFYLGYQMLDGYVLTPLVQRRTVSLPPALTIMAQVLMGVVWGAMGVLLAVPLTATALVLVKMIYLEDTLGEHIDLPGIPIKTS